MLRLGYNGQSANLSDKQS
uniref:Uncharacterized protein n=1 Tax=Rhizophora mucronata TaxID=61149 RepID=A0A2P2PCB9_RHIMU